MILVANLLILLINLGVLALSIKCYTEILKDQSQNRRAARAMVAQDEQRK